MREKIVYVENSGYGNAILSVPMLKAIKIAKPKCELIYLGWNRSNRILEGADFIDLILSIEQGQPILSNFLPHIDHFLISPVGAIDEVVKTLSKISKNIHKIDIGPVWSRHESEIKLELAKKLGYVGLSTNCGVPVLPKCEIPIFEYNHENAKEFLKSNHINKFITVNASFLKDGHWNKKHLGDKKYAQIIHWINKNYPEYKFVFLGCKDDIKHVDQIILESEINNCCAINACGLFEDIKDSCAIISQSSLMVGNDGAQNHISAVLHIPTITIFTFTNIIKNRPLGKNSYIVANKCDKRISCQHDVSKIENQCRLNGCLDISIDKIIEQTRLILNGTN